MGLGKLLRGAADVADRASAAFKENGLKGVLAEGEKVAQQTADAVQEGATKLAKDALTAGSEALDKAGERGRELADKIDGPKPPKPGA